MHPLFSVALAVINLICPIKHGYVIAFPQAPKKKTFATFAPVTKVWLVRLGSNG
jgi:hypothetical protein